MIEVIGKEGCAKCDMVKSLLDKRGIKYLYTNSSEDNTGYLKEKILKENDGRYPMILIDNEIVSLKDVLK